MCLWDFLLWGAADRIYRVSVLMSLPAPSRSECLNRDPRSAASFYEPTGDDYCGRFELHDYDLSLYMEKITKEPSDAAGKVVQSLDKIVLMQKPRVR